MIKKMISWNLVIVLIASLVLQAGEVKADMDEIIFIHNAEDLDRIRENLAGNYRLMADIDLSTYTNWEPIGDNSEPFRGQLDGMGYTIAHLTITRDSQDYVGLFGKLDGATIRNLDLSQVDISGRHHVGAIAGNANESMIDFSHVSGSIEGRNFVGGLIGDSANLFIRNAHTYLSVSGVYHVGGLTGRAIDLYIDQSFSSGSVRGADHVGGLAGNVRVTEGNETGSIINQSHSTSNINGNIDTGGLVGTVNRNVTSSAVHATINESYATGSVNGRDNAGGLVGYAVNLSISHSYASGSVNGTNSIGGIVGYANPSTQVEYSYWDLETTGRTSSAAGGTGLTTEQMMQQISFSGWDFNHMWMIAEEKTYPIHRWQGAGSEEDPFIIRSPQQLDFVRHGLSFHYKLDAPIHLQDYNNWNPIGNQDHPFTGSLDGSGYTISNLTINRTNEQFVGLFSDISGGKIRSVNLRHVDIRGRNFVGGFAGRLGNTSEIVSSSSSGAVRGNWYVGGLVGYMDRSSIENSSVAGSITGSQMIGGLAGEAMGTSTIRESYSSVHINRNSIWDDMRYAGGLVGFGDRLTIEQSYAIGSISGSSNDFHIGGLVGYLESSSSIYQSYAAVDVTGHQEVGGLVGYLSGSSIEQSYAIGSVTADRDAGGLVGRASSFPRVTITSSFWDTQTTGQETSAGNAGTGLSTDEMHTRETFEEWDFRDVWYMLSPVGYPQLKIFSDKVPVISLESLREIHVTFDNEEELAISGRVDNVLAGDTVDVEYTVRNSSGETLPGMERQVLVSSGSLEGTEFIFAESLLLNDMLEPGNYSIAVTARTSRAESNEEIISLNIYPKPEIEISLQFSDGTDYISGTWTNQTIRGTAHFDYDVASTRQFAFVDDGEYPLEEDWTTLPGHSFSIAGEMKGTLFLRTENEVGYQHMILFEQIWVDQVEPGSPVILASTTEWTNEPVTIDVTHGVAGISGLDRTEYKIGAEGDWQVYDDVIVISDEGEHYLYARTWDRAGNVTPEENIPVVRVRIHHTPPIIQTDLRTEDGQVYEPDTWTNQAVTVTAAVYSTGFPVVNPQISMDGGVSWEPYSGHTVVISTEGYHSIQLRAGDELGNVTSLERIIKIDQTKPMAPIMELSREGWTNEPIEVRLTVGSDDLSGIAKTEYRIGDEGGWHTYLTPFHVHFEGETTLYARNVDRAGNMSEQVQAVTRIDRETPALSLQGDSQVIMERGTAYVDAGARAVHSRFGNLDESIEITGSYDSNHAGTYLVTYTVIDPAGNSAQVQRDILVVDIIDLDLDSGDSPIQVEVNSSAPIHVIPIYDREVVPTITHNPVFSSSNVSIATVDSEGTITFHQVGVVSLNITYGPLEKVLTFNVKRPARDSVVPPPSTEPEEHSDGEEPKEPTEPSDESTEPLPTIHDIDGHWAEKDIRNAISKQIIHGYPDGTFKPDQLITRAEFTVMLVNAFYVEGDASTALFSDHENIGEWARPAVYTAAHRGIISGYEDRSFRPNQFITRTEMAIMIAAHLDLRDPSMELDAFVDQDEIPIWAREAVSSLLDERMMMGRAANRFAPNDSATRAEAITIIMRVLNRA